MSATLTIAIVTDDPDRATLFSQPLQRDGWDCRVFRCADLLRQTDKTRSGMARPDIIIVDMPQASGAALAELVVATQPLRQAVAVFVNKNSANLAKAATDAGLSAFVVDGLQPERIRSVVDAALARFAQLDQMRRALAEAKLALEERKVIDRAKGMLMRARNLDEAAAYGLLRKAAMDQNRKLADVARALVSTAGLLG